MQVMYFGPKAVSLDSLPTNVHLLLVPQFKAYRSLSMASRPSDCLPALCSASLGMHTARTEAFDRLYAAEFKRFIAGKLVDRPPNCMCIYSLGSSSWSKRKPAWSSSRLIATEGI